MKQGVEERRMLNFGEDAVPEGAGGEGSGGGFVEPEGLEIETPEAECGGQREDGEKDEEVTSAGRGHG